MPVTPGTPAISFRYGRGIGKISDTRWRVIMRFAAAPVTPAFHAPTIVRIRPNAITAVAIPTMVSAVRRRCRKRFLKTSRSSFTAGPSLQFALVQVAYEMGALGGVRVVRHHHDRLLELLVQPLEQRQDLLGGLAI